MSAQKRPGCWLAETMHGLVIADSPVSSSLINVRNGPATDGAVHGIFQGVPTGFPQASSRLTRKEIFLPVVVVVGEVAASLEGTPGPIRNVGDFGNSS